MKVTFANRTVPLGDETRNGIEGRIHFALSRFGSYIEQVSVRIAKGDRVSGGDRPQVLCRLSVRMKLLGSFSVDSVNEGDPVVAASWAAERAAKRVHRILDRQRFET